MRRAPLLLCMLALAGCDDFDRLAQLKPRRLTVRANDISLFPDGGQLVTPVAYAIPCQARVDAALESGWQRVEGEWVEPGLCVLRDVLPGETLVKVPSNDVWIVVSQNDVDLGADFLGRPFQSALPNTTVTLDVSNATPFSKKTFISMYLPDFGKGLNNTLGVGSDLVGVSASAGATSFPVTLDWATLPLLKQGERIEVFESIMEDSKSVPNIPFNDTRRVTLSRHGTAELLPVESRTVRGPLVLAPAAAAATPFPSVSFDPRGAYQQFKVELPAPVFLGAVIDQQAQVSKALSGLSVGSTFTVNEQATFNVPPVNLDPFPGLTWTGEVAVAIYFDSALSLPSGETGLFSLAANFHGPASEQSWLSTGALTPPRDLRVKRTDGNTVSSGSLESTTPVLVWNRPAMGLPNRYQVKTFAASGLGDGGVDFNPVLTRIETERTECHFPPELLQPNTSYVFQVTAENCTAADPSRPGKLNRQSTCGYSQNVSLVFTTPP